MSTTPVNYIFTHIINFTVGTHLKRDNQMLQINFQESENEHANEKAKEKFESLLKDFNEMACLNEGHKDSIILVKADLGNMEHYIIEVKECCCGEFRFRLQIGPLRKSNFQVYYVGGVENPEHTSFENRQWLFENIDETIYRFGQNREYMEFIIQPDSMLKYRTIIKIAPKDKKAGIKDKIEFEINKNTINHFKT